MQHHMCSCVDVDCALFCC